MYNYSQNIKLKDNIMKKNLFMLLLLLFLPIGLMAQTLVKDPDTQLEYLTDDTDLTNKESWYIYVASTSTIDPINGTPANQYFVPHSNFRIYVRNQCGAPSDGKIYWNTLQEKTTFSAAWNTSNGSSNSTVRYKGIEYFPNLTAFADNGEASATSIEGDFSKNKNLSSLTLSANARNKFKSLDISNTKMTSIVMPAGLTSGFTFTAKNSALTSLSIGSSNVSKLDVSGSADLTSLTTKTSNSAYLTEVNVAGTGLTSLNLSKYTALAKVTFDKSKMDTWGTSGTKLILPTNFAVVHQDGNTTTLMKSNATHLVVDVTDSENKHVDVSTFTNLSDLEVIGATGVTLPANKTKFILNGTGSPDLKVDFAEQAMRTTLTELTLINMNQVDISSCDALVTLNLEGTGTEWGDGSADHLGVICNTGATSDSWTLPALTKIMANSSGVQKLDLTNAAANLKILNICKSTMKELRVPNHLGFTKLVTSYGTDSGSLSLGYNTVDTENLFVKLTTDPEGSSAKWKSKDEFEWNQLEVLDISGCSGIVGKIIITPEQLNYNQSTLREFYANGCSGFVELIIYNASLDTIDVQNCSSMGIFKVEQSRLKTVDLSGCPNLTGFFAKRNRFTDGDFLTMPCRGRTETDIAKLANIQLNGGASASKMKNVEGKEGTPTVVVKDIFTNNISNFDTQYLGSNLKRLLIADNLLQTLELHDRLTGLQQIEIENNMLLTLDLSNIPTTLEGSNWGWDMSKEKMQVGFLNVEEVKGMYNPEIDSGSKDWVALPLPNGGGFKHLLDNTVKLYPSIEDALDDTNEIAKEAHPFMGTIEDFNDSIGYEVLCPTGHTGEHLFLHSQEEIKSDHGGKIADQDLYDKVLIYKYNTQFNGGNPAVGTKGEILDPHIEIRAHIWPYILNINPATRDKDDNTTGLNYYSSTIYLDYDAIIPQGVTVHVPVGVDTAYREIGRPGQDYTMQFDMKEVGKAGQVLPKGTPVLVKSVTVDDSPEYEPGGAAGLYSFQTAWDFDIKGWEDYRSNIVKAAVAAERGCDPDEVYAVLHGVDEENVIYKPGFDPDENPEKWINTDPTIAEYLSQNMLTGTLNDTTVARKSILTLGRQQAKGPDGTASLRIGFWRFNGTLLHAHRCYITEETLHNAMDRAGMTDAKPGGIFDFGDSYTTGVRTIVTNPQDKGEQAVYDLQGRRITGTPVPGIYIVNGKKVIVKH